MRYSTQDDFGPTIVKWYSAKDDTHRVEFKIYQTEPACFSMSYNDAWISALFEKYDAAMLAIEKDLNEVEELWAERKAKGNVEGLTVEELKSLNDSDGGGGNSGDHASD